MTIYMVRDDCTDSRTLGTMTFEDGYVCQTLEDPVRPEGVKLLGDTAIPSGTYRVTITRSQRFQRMLPLLHSVPMFDGIRIHPGNNNKADTTGCILVGTQRGVFSVETGAEMQILHSRDAMAEVQKRISACVAAGDLVWLDIVTPRVTTSETFSAASMADATGFP
jgi:hypothetical protein